jgi:hypothetical protein
MPLIVKVKLDRVGEQASRKWPAQQIPRRSFALRQATMLVREDAADHQTFLFGRREDLSIWQ